MAMVLIHGKMEDNTSVNGKMESSMVKGFTDKVLAKREEAYGKMERESNGVMNDTLLIILTILQAR